MNIVCKREPAGAGEAVPGELAAAAEHARLEADRDRLELDGRVLVQPGAGLDVELLAVAELGQEDVAVAVQPDERVAVRGAELVDEEARSRRTACCARP